MNRTTILVCLFFLIANACVSASPAPTPTYTLSPTPDYWPGDDWRRAAPEEVGLDERSLSQLDALFEDGQVKSLLVVKDGYLVYEKYAPGIGADSLFEVWSVTKSVMSALIGIAIWEGYLGGVDQPISQFFPVMQQEGLDPRKREITIRHFLTHTSGFEWDDNAELSRLEVAGPGVMIGKPLVASPGQVFAYSTGGFHMLSHILQTALDQVESSPHTGMTTEEFAQSTLFGPLGIENYEWDDDSQRVNYGGYGLMLTARDMAKFGYLYLRNGLWDGDRVIPSEWISQSTTRQVAGPGSSPYGYGWWLTSFDRPDDAYVAMGLLGQFIYVLPDHDLVVVMTARIKDGSEDRLGPAIWELLPGHE